MTATLNLHSEGREVTREVLNTIAPVLSPTDTYFPQPHGLVVDTVTGLLEEGGFQVRGAHYGVSRAGARMFATLDLATPVADGVSLAVGIRNSTDKSLPLGFCAGNRVFVCSNLAFHSELMVTRKHTRFGADRFREAIALAVGSLTQFQQVEARRIETFRKVELPDVRAESLILRSFERGLVSSRQLPKVIAAYREPHFEEFQPRTLWALLNAYVAESVI